MYKEFLEIANEMIPNVMRTSSGDHPSGASSGGEVAASPAREQSTDKLLLTSDPECYAMVLRFYDGLCEWEEGSSTPVLHITWARHALYSFGRFDFRARANLVLKCAAPVDNADAKSDDSVVSSRSSKLKQMSDGPDRSGRRTRDKTAKAGSPESAVNGDEKSPTDATVGHFSPAGSPPGVENPDDKPVESQDKVSDEKTTSRKIAPLTTQAVEEHSSAMAAEVAASGGDGAQACLVLRSEKMMGMKDLLVAERLNSGAVELQLTAQSQVHLRHSRTAAAAADYATLDATSSASRKRIRRE